MEIMIESLNILIWALDDQDAELFLIDQKFKEKGIYNYKLFSQVDLFKTEFNDNVNLAIVDYKLNSTETGIDIVKFIRDKNLFCKNIIVSGITDVDTIVEFFRNGATDFVRKDKPTYLDDLVEAVKRSIPTIEQMIEKIKYAKKWLPDEPK